MSCIWCHNPESQLPDREIIYKENRCLRCGACAEHCPHDAIQLHDVVETIPELCERCSTCLEFCFADARELAGRDISVKDLIHEIEKDQAFFQESDGGVTLSGGEPLMQPKFCAAVLEECKSRGFRTALDTCGYAEWSVIENARKFVDLFLYDLKIMDDAEHVKYTGVSNDIILQNLKRLSELGQQIVIRMPIIPGITDDEKNISAISEFVADLPDSHQIELLPYHHIAQDKYHRLQRSYALEKLSTPTEAEMLRIKQRMLQFGLGVYIGG